MDEEKIYELWLFVSNKRNYKVGVTNKQILEKFGTDYERAWRKLKDRSRRYTGILFYEGKRWFAWEPN